MEVKEAADLLNNLVGMVEDNHGEDYDTALKMGIEALSANGDMISRQAAIDALKGLPTWWADSGGYYGGAQPPMEALLEPEDAISALENLPSAQPERKTGRWIELTNTNHTYVCSVCGRMLVNITDGKNTVTKNYPFCHCGARMVQEGEANERA